MDLTNLCTPSELTSNGDLSQLDHDHYIFGNINHMIMKYHYNIANSLYDNSAIQIENKTRQLQHYMSALKNVDRKFEIILTVSAYVVLMVVSLFGNLLVLCSILSYRRLLVKTTNKLIVNLTVADLLLTTVCIPLTLVRLLVDSWPFGPVLCAIGLFVQALSLYVTTISMVVIALERYYVLLGSALLRRVGDAFPFACTSLAIWLLAALLSMPHYLFTRVVHKQWHTCVQQCQPIYPRPALLISQAVTIFTFITQYFVPLVFIAICYTRIGQHTWRRAFIGALTSPQRSHQLRNRKRTIKMLILVVIVFAICWLPLRLYYLILDLLPGSSFSKSVFILCHWFGMSSVCFNPFIYFGLNEQYKRRAKMILNCFCFRRKENRRECIQNSNKSQTTVTYVNDRIKLGQHSRTVHTSV